MEVYFVRHGESEFESNLIHRDHTPGLSLLGRKQAETLAKRLRSFNIDTFLSSDYKRAQETAEILSESIGISFTTNEYLREGKRPKELIGLRYDDPKAVEIKQAIKDNAHDADWRYSDEENFFDLKKRAQILLQHMEQLSVSYILAVSHERMIQMVVGLIIFPDLTPHMYYDLCNRLKMMNTGITTCLFENNAWKVITWNDCSHLK